jgi:hypothetical protein
MLLAWKAERKPSLVYDQKLIVLVRSDRIYLSSLVHLHPLRNGGVPDSAMRLFESIKSTKEKKLDFLETILD